ncbi:MAG: hypothetical protein QNJ22_02930 [Desulfosarcinaceae bacterium]|nr:hypothetical protein [Desulfosarcinaceae bacterium]
MDLNIAFWNLGNLFDTIDSPISQDFEFTPDKGWTAETQTAKIGNLAAVINQMFDGNGPDLLGICEVENEAVLKKLVEAVTVRNDLAILQFEDGPDIRGIDCALVYSDQKFEPIRFTDPEPPAPKGHLIHNRYPTRDIFEAPLKVLDNDAELIVYINHWPSRSRGRYKTESLRIAAAYHLGRLIDQRLKMTRQELLALPDTAASMNLLQARWNRNILAMGDFNDEPFNRSVMEELRASSGLDKLEEPVERSGTYEHIPDVVPYAKLQASLFNCMWPTVATPDRGSYFYGSSIPTMNMLDQFLVTRGLYYGLSGLKMIRDTAYVPAVHPDEPPIEMEEDTIWTDVFDSDLMITSKDKRRPKKFKFEMKDGHARHNNGYSDHFPIVTAMEVL